MNKVFLSHFSDDKVFVRKVKNKLSRLWTYYDEDCFEPGVDFRDEIVKKLSETTLFVFFVSQNSLQSSWVKFELDEAYWQKTTRNNISTLVLALEEITVDDLPHWMRRSKYAVVRSAQQAAQQIRYTFFSISPSENYPYIGREQDAALFQNKIADLSGFIPNIFAIIGLSGVGRRRFIEDIMSRNYNLPILCKFEVDISEGLVELYRKLLDYNQEGLSDNDIQSYYNIFISSDTQTQVEEVARSLSRYTDNQACPALVDNGGMLNDDGTYATEFELLLKYFSENYPSSYLTLIHTRKPKWISGGRNTLFVTRLEALTSNNCYILFAALLRRRQIDTSDDKKIREIAEYLEGYPPAIIYAVQECEIEGVDYVLHDKRCLTDYQERIFKSYLDSILKSDDSNNNADVLSLIHNMSRIAIDPMVTILGKKESDVLDALRHLHDCNVIDVCSDGTYEIASPIKVSVERRVKRFTKSDFAGISKKLIETYWDQEDIPPFHLVDNMIYAVLRSGNDEYLQQYKIDLLPTHFLKAARKANQDQEWSLAEKWARAALKLNQNLLDAIHILFMVLVRQESSQNRTQLTDEEDELLEQLKSRKDKRVYYLSGFRYMKRRRYPEAINQFNHAILAGDRAISVYRELSECYYQINEITKAQSQIDEVMKKEKYDNPFILDLASKIYIAIGDYDNARKSLEKQELVDHPENVKHRWATFYLKQGEVDLALKLAQEACQGSRVLSEMHLLLMGIAVRKNDRALVQREYNDIPKKYKNYSREVLEVLYTTMLLNNEGWSSAEAAFGRISGESPYKNNLRYKIISKKCKIRKSLLLKRKSLKTKRNSYHSRKALTLFRSFNVTISNSFLNRFVYYQENTKTKMLCCALPTKVRIAENLHRCTIAISGNYA